VGYGLVLQQDGKIVVAGQVYNGVDDDVILLRLENSPCDVNESNESSHPDDTGLSAYSNSVGTEVSPVR
jgi:hypothetical protein